ncbi:uncharacterized protein KY384_008164 [Bacidia gigantensis]|uniref:uncharacterized protein n=1 Tax=Bacidia gigantensis TaxID=2732470 RepID=UPI001D044C0B|nr:uncharacterized protein KY384_008164 [Bacidia gigantensis]KAG8526735.1 hypothetical protein KY384_008164 [Bacidia gigantensis]
MILTDSNPFNLTSISALPDLNITTFLPPNPTLPIRPDFSICDSFYGSNLLLDDATSAIAKLRTGADPVHYLINQPSALFNLPFTVQHNLVAISVEPAGPFRASAVLSIALRPNLIRSLAGHLMSECVASYGIGGYATLEILSLLTYVTFENVNIQSIPYPGFTVFATVTIGSRYRYMPPPGDYDPKIAAALAEAEGRAEAAAPSSEKRVFAERKSKFAARAATMRVFLTTWWDFLRASSNEKGTRIKDG